MYIKKKHLAIIISILITCDKIRTQHGYYSIFIPFLAVLAFLEKSAQ